MRCHIDTNVALDFFLHREPYYESTELLFILGKLQELDLTFGLSQLSDLIYLLTEGGRKSKASYATDCLKRLVEVAHICSLNETEVKEALELGWSDLQDVLVYQTARSMKADVIITRDKGDFGKSKIPVLDCAEFFAWLSAEKNVTYAFIDLE